MRSHTSTQNSSGSDRFNLAVGVVGFAISMIATWWFIQSYGGYISFDQMLLSGGIAGGKWAIQLALAWLFLGQLKYRYFRELGIICGIGSTVLIPFAMLSGEEVFFVGSLITCVLVMAGLICVRLPSIGLSRGWVVLWFALLGIAVLLQVTLVFG